MGIERWIWCDDLDAPEIGLCVDDDWWYDNKEDVIEWFENEGKGCGSIFSHASIFVSKDNRALFLLRFG